MTGGQPAHWSVTTLKIGDAPFRSTIRTSRATRRSCVARRRARAGLRRPWPDRNHRDRPGLREAMAACRAGDVLVVTKLDRLARSLSNARNIVAELTEREVKLRKHTWWPCSCRRAHDRRARGAVLDDPIDGLPRSRPQPNPHGTLTLASLKRELRASGSMGPDSLRHYGDPVKRVHAACTADVVRSRSSATLASKSRCVGGSAGSAIDQCSQLGGAENSSWARPQTVTTGIFWERALVGRMRASVAEARARHARLWQPHLGVPGWPDACRPIAPAAGSVSSTNAAASWERAELWVHTNRAGCGSS